MSVLSIQQVRRDVYDFFKDRVNAHHRFVPVHAFDDYQSLSYALERMKVLINEYPDAFADIKDDFNDQYFTDAFALINADVVLQPQRKKRRRRRKVDVYEAIARATKKSNDVNSRKRQRVEILVNLIESDYRDELNRMNREDDVASDAGLPDADEEVMDDVNRLSDYQKKGIVELYKYISYLKRIQDQTDQQVQMFLDDNASDVPEPSQQEEQHQPRDIFDDADQFFAPLSDEEDDIQPSAATAYVRPPSPPPVLPADEGIDYLQQQLVQETEERIIDSDFKQLIFSLPEDLREDIFSDNGSVVVKALATFVGLNLDALPLNELDKIYDLLQYAGYRIHPDLNSDTAGIDGRENNRWGTNEGIMRTIFDLFERIDNGIRYIDCTAAYNFVLSCRNAFGRQQPDGSFAPSDEMQNLYMLQAVDNYATTRNILGDSNILPPHKTVSIQYLIELIELVDKSLWHKLPSPQIGRGHLETGLTDESDENFERTLGLKIVNERNTVVIKNFKIILLMFVLYFLGNSDYSQPGDNYVYFDAAPIANVKFGQTTLNQKYFRYCGVWQNNNFMIPLEKLISIFDHVFDVFRRAIFGPENSVSWDGGVSGDVYIRRDDRYGCKCYLHASSVGVFRAAARWIDSYRVMLDSIFPDGGFLTVLNRDDNLCFVYMIAVAMAKINDRGFLKEPERYFEVSTIYSRLAYDQPEKHPESISLLREAMTAPLSERCRYLEDKANKLYTLQEFIAVMKELEEKFVPTRYRIDVAVIEPAKSKRLFPVYASERDGDTISLFMIRDGDNSHFCLISDAEVAWRSTKGKLFVCCSKCHKTFFSQRLFNVHDCEKSETHKAWHWNSFGFHDDANCVGYCSRCHLQFDNKYEFEHHQKHCFMIGRRGTRFVSLPEDPWLRGKAPSEKSSSVDRVLFADFECSIDPLTGEHRFMSFGLFDVPTCEYFTGLSIEGFMDILIRKSREGKHLKVYFHNAMGYDANFILKYILSDDEKFGRWGIQTIMKSSSRLEKLSFSFYAPDLGTTKNRKRIIEIGDTFRFISMSLDKIVKSVKTDSVEENKKIFPYFFETLAKAYPSVSDEEINSILKKNLFPYNFFRSRSDLSVSMSFFQNMFAPLTANLVNFAEGVTVADLAANRPHFDSIVKTFNCRTAGDYHDLYLLCDVMQITDVFLHMRETFKKHQKVDLLNYIGLPAAAWDALLLYDKSMIIPLYSNTWFQEFFSLGIRGGVTLATLRYAKATPSMSIVYFDKNGLYPDEMVKHEYPCGKLVRIRFDAEEEEEEEEEGYVVIPSVDPCAPKFNPKEQTPNDYLMKVYFPWLKERHKGCFISVDLHITKELAEKTDQFPFAPEHVEIHDDYMDPDTGEYYDYLKRWCAANDGEQMPTFKGLVATMYDKKEYHVHWQLLQWYIEHGIEVTKLHECVQFDERPYLRGFIQRNIDMRNQFTDAMNKMFWKLSSNACYGKSFENNFNRSDFEIVRNRDTLTGLIDSGNVLSILPIDANNSVVRLDGDETVLDKPTYIGACITEFAKLSMYKAFYDELPKMFSKVELVYTDTDSFILCLHHPEGWGAKEIFEHIEKCSPGFIGSKGGQWKSETGEDLIEEVIALRSKVYTYKTKSGKIGKRAKGTTSAAQQELDWESYKSALLDLRAVPVSNVVFKRQGFRVSTEEMMKRALSGNDGKRIIEPDGIHTHTIGYSRFFH